MLQSWTSYGSDGMNHSSEDVRTLAINVLAFAGFSKVLPVQEFTASGYNRENPFDVPRRSSYHPAECPDPPRCALTGIFLTIPTNEMDADGLVEKQLISEGKAGSGTLLSNLVRAPDQPQKPEEKRFDVSKAHKPLSTDEILGNIFVFNFAGHDTTSISLAYAVFLLVAHPGIQDWISEEINFYLGSEPDPTSWQHATTVPKLQRCLAVLLETLRLYNPIPGVPKHTSPRPQHSTLSDKQTLNIPPNTLLIASLEALHTHPRYWGSDSLTWRPSRWIISSSFSTTTPQPEPTLSTEKLLHAQKGTFIAWSEGLQNCPSRKIRPSGIRSHDGEVI
ncbi:MAG: hypothetical protein Q9221_001552 [Calogaya cf. arnoldii]